MTFLTQCPPTNIYETLYRFKEAYGAAMGTEGTHYWSQGCPRTSQIPGGPSMPSSININAKQLKYPSAQGLLELRECIANYYNKWYSSPDQTPLTPENIMIYPGGRPSMVGVFSMLSEDVEIRLGSTEYAALSDVVKGSGKTYKMVENSKRNKFNPKNSQFFDNFPGHKDDQKVFAYISNPHNPTGITKKGDNLREFVEMASRPNCGALIDEAYELFYNEPVSAMKYIEDINKTNVFVTGACTKGFQSPGIRIGWVIGSKDNIEQMSNFCSSAMGGVSHLSQIYAIELLEESRVELARTALPEYYSKQRIRYGQAFKQMGFKVWSGDGAPYHWIELPNNISADEFNTKLFSRGASVLAGICSGMGSDKENKGLESFFRFSFGPLEEESFEEDCKILQEALDECLCKQ